MAPGGPNPGIRLITWGNMFDSAEKPSVRYLVASETPHRHLVLAEQPGGRVFGLAAVFFDRRAADEYVDIVGSVVAGRLVPVYPDTLIAHLLEIHEAGKAARKRLRQRQPRSAETPPA